MTNDVVDPSRAPEIVEAITVATFRSAFDNELSSKESRWNMVSFMEEFFDLDDANLAWEAIDNTVKQIERLKEATGEVL
jgi:tryptophan 2,3-dioxygenase